MPTAAPAKIHPLHNLPTTRRIDTVLAVLSASKKTPHGGWSTADLADLCGCSQAAIRLRLQESLSKLKQHPDLQTLLQDLKSEP